VVKENTSVSHTERCEASPQYDAISIIINKIHAKFVSKNKSNNSSVSVKSSLLSSVYILQIKSLEGILNQRRDLPLKAVTYFVQNSIRRDGSEHRFYLERGYFERLKIYSGHEA
jgi:hypothetical protein